MSSINVVGAGLSGLSFAIKARLGGESVTIFDKSARPILSSGLSSNVISVNKRSAKFLKSIGALDELEDSSKTSFQEIVITDSDGVGRVSFSSKAIQEDRLGLIIESEALKQAMLKLAQSLDIKIFWQYPFTSDLLKCDLLVAADGPNSAARQALGIKTLRYSYDQSANVCVVEATRPTNGTAFQWFGKEGPLALLPLSYRGKFAVVWSTTQDFGLQPEDYFEKKLNVRTREKLGKLKMRTKRFCFPLQQKHALKYVKDGVALIGDSAHTIHPLAGQGGNLGFADAEILAKEISMAKIEGLGVRHQNILKRYEKSRRLEAFMFGLTMEAFHRGYGSRNSGIQLVRSLGMNHVQENDHFKRLAILIASGGFL
ncbi:MAG: FAD-dependent monooxygenase [Pseudomonadota bacterium]|nr:FAD-dependent monooxygenase [Pseudomonadota bacterium]